MVSEVDSVDVVSSIKLGLGVEVGSNESVCSVAEAPLSIAFELFCASLLPVVGAATVGTGGLCSPGLEVVSEDIAGRCNSC